MKKLIIVAVFLFAVGSLFAGEGKSCHKSGAKNVELSGSVTCADGQSGDDCAPVFRASNGGTEYKICDKSKVKGASLAGTNVKITGQLVNCDDEGEVLVISKATKI